VEQLKLRLLKKAKEPRPPKKKFVKDSTWGQVVGVA